jgi:pyrroloquinoline quinone biosynthesis protein B
MASYLTGNGPWSQLVGIGNISLREFAPGTPLQLAPGLTVTALAVPHRDELSDTVGFVVRGPRRALLYVPDTEPWNKWPQPLPEVLRGIDVALLDATFFDAGELPGRDVTKIGHPLVTSTMELLAEQVRGGKLDVAFTHLNHSNPALDPASAAAQEIARRGFRILAEGEEISL